MKAGHMKERPILMSGPMVRSAWKGRKTNTRRVIKGADRFPIVSFERWVVDGEPQYRPSGLPLWFSTEADGTTREWGCPYGEPGDRLWVREAWFSNSIDYPEQTDHSRENLYYRADGHYTRDCEAEDLDGHWKPSIHMPRWASRLMLEIVDIRVERLQDITEEDAISEGVHFDMASSGIPVYADYMTGLCLPNAKSSFRTLWESLNGKRPGCDWASSPWVWAITFRKVEATDDPV